MEEAIGVTNRIGVLVFSGFSYYIDLTMITMAKAKKRFFQNKKVWLAIFLVGLLAFLVYVLLSVGDAFRYTANTNTPVAANTPAAAGLAYEDVTFPTATTDGVNLRGWWIPNPASSRVIIFTHGRGGDRNSYAALFKPLWEAGFNILTYDMRGHGQSDSAFCSWGIKEQWDLVGAVNFAKTKGFKPGAIGVIGWSVGAATSLMATRSDPDIGAVVSDSAYANSGPLLARNFLYPGLVTALRLVRGIDLNQIDPVQAITQLGSRHALLIHGAADKLVGVYNVYKLQQAGRISVSDTWVVPNTDHTEAYHTQPEEYLRRVTEFFKLELK